MEALTASAIGGNYASNEAILADVGIVATYELYNINRIKLENLFYRVFDPAQLDIELGDRFGNPVKPRAWFLVPLFVVDEAVQRIKDGTITQYVHDPTGARLVKVTSLKCVFHESKYLR